MEKITFNFTIGTHVTTSTEATIKCPIRLCYTSGTIQTRIWFAFRTSLKIKSILKKLRNGRRGGGGKERFFFVFFF